MASPVRRRGATKGGPGPRAAQGETPTASLPGLGGRRV
ncbi:hypothetical protein ATKI12_0030 [Kitasatospora sp. Ki12]